MFLFPLDSISEKKEVIPWPFSPHSCWSWQMNHRGKKRNGPGVPSVRHGQQAEWPSWILFSFLLGILIYMLAACVCACARVCVCVCPYKKVESALESPKNHEISGCFISNKLYHYLSLMSDHMSWFEGQSISINNNNKKYWNSA